MNYPALQTDLIARGYTAQSDPQATGAAMNALTSSVRNSYFVNYRTIMGVAGQAPVERLGALLATQSPVTHSILLQAGLNDGSSGGMDMANAATQGFVAELPNMTDANGNLGFTAAHVTTLTALGQSTPSYVSQTYDVPALTATDIIVAFGGDAVVGGHL